MIIYIFSSQQEIIPIHITNYSQCQSMDLREKKIEPLEVNIRYHRSFVKTRYHIEFNRVQNIKKKKIFFFRVFYECFLYYSNIKQEIIIKQEISQVYNVCYTYRNVFCRYLFGFFFHSPGKIGKIIRIRDVGFGKTIQKYVCVIVKNRKSYFNVADLRLNRSCPKTKYTQVLCTKKNVGIRRKSRIIIGIIFFNSIIRYVIHVDGYCSL